MGPSCAKEKGKWIYFFFASSCAAGGAIPQAFPSPQVNQGNMPGIQSTFLAMDTEEGVEVVWNELLFTDKKAFKAHEVRPGDPSPPSWVGTAWQDGLLPLWHFLGFSLQGGPLHLRAESL